VEGDTLNRAASTIQRHWRQYQTTRQDSQRDVESLLVACSELRRQVSTLLTACTKASVPLRPEINPVADSSQLVDPGLDILLLTGSPQPRYKWGRD
jgi:hypothetical protein